MALNITSQFDGSGGVLHNKITQGNTGNWLNNRENKNNKPSIDRKRLTPQEVLEINTANKMTTKLLKRAISNAYRHGLGLKTGILNAANGNCLFDAILANIKGRGCYKTKVKESSKQLRIRSITKAQLEKHLLTFIRTNTTEAEWETLKRDRVYETELGDIAIIAVARAIHMDILIFNTNAEVSISPIETVNADEYEGGSRTNINPIILAYNGSHYESLETLSIEDDKKAIDLVHLVKTKGYKLKKRDIAIMARISKSTKPEINITKEPEGKAKVNKG